MEKTDRKTAGSSEIARVPAFGVTPPPRCFTTLEGSPPRKCGELATRHRVGNSWFGDSFHCDDHAEQSDVDISDEFVIRLVRVTCDVLLAGVDEHQGIAQAEAVDRLERAVVAAGGVLDVKIATSSIGRYPAHVGAPGARTRPGSRE